MFTTVNLEMSIKPFKKTDTEYIRKVCSKIFHQWYPLLKNRKVISVMLWVADGSEILDYNKKLFPDRTFDEICAELCPIFRKKFGPDGYARKKMFVKDPDYEKFLEEITELTEDLETFKNFAKML